MPARRSAHNAEPPTSHDRDEVFRDVDELTALLKPDKRTRKPEEPIEAASAPLSVRMQNIKRTVRDIIVSGTHQSMHVLQESFHSLATAAAYAKNKDVSEFAREMKEYVFTKTNEWGEADSIIGKPVARIRIAVEELLDAASGDVRNMRTRKKRTRSMRASMPVIAAVGETLEQRQLLSAVAATANDQTILHARMDTLTQNMEKMTQARATLDQVMDMRDGLARPSFLRLQFDTYVRAIQGHYDRCAEQVRTDLSTIAASTNTGAPDALAENATAMMDARATLDQVMHMRSAFSRGSYMYMQFGRYVSALQGRYDRCVERVRSDLAVLSSATTDESTTDTTADPVQESVDEGATSGPVETTPGPAAGATSTTDSTTPAATGGGGGGGGGAVTAPPDDPTTIIDTSPDTTDVATTDTADTHTSDDTSETAQDITAVDTTEDSADDTQADPASADDSAQSDTTDTTVTATDTSDAESATDDVLEDSADDDVQDAIDEQTEPADVTAPDIDDTTTDNPISEVEHADETEAANATDSTTEETPTETVATDDAADRSDAGDTAEDDSMIDTAEEPVENVDDTVEEPVENVDDTVEEPVENVDDAAALARSLTASLQAVLQEDAEKIGYPKMFVSYENQGSSTLFTVRFRNPGPMSDIQVLIDNNDGSYDVRGTDVEGPVADGSYSFRLSRRANGGGQEVIMRLRDAPNGTILAEVRGGYNTDNNTASVGPRQIPFEQEEQGMLSENPIVPEVKLLRINGVNMLLTVQSPHDGSSLYFPMTGGMLSHTTLSHTGGTTFMTAMLTFDASRPTGYYTLNLCDGASSMVVDTMVFHWDHDGKSLSLANPADQFTGDQSTAEGIETFNSMTGIVSSYVADPQISWIERSRLYEQSRSLPAPYNFGDINLTERIFQAHPEYMDQNWEQGINAMWDKIGHGFTRGRAEQMFQDGRVAYINAKAQQLNIYADVMANLLQQAVNVFVQVRQGGNEASLKLGLQQSIDQYNNVQHLNIYQLTGSAISGLWELGISVPSCTNILTAAGQLLQNNWHDFIVAQQDMVAYQHYADVQRENGGRLTAEGEWVAITGGTYTEEIAAMDTRQVRTAAKIAGVLQNSTDSRIVAWNDAAKQELALRVAKALPENATDEEIVRVTTVAIVELSAELKALNTENYGEIMDLEMDIKTLYMNGDSTFTGNFSIRESSMVNLSLTHEGGPYDHSATLSICDSAGKELWSNAHTAASANTISCTLPKGDYKIVVKTAPDELFQSSEIPSVLHLGIDAKHINTAKIEGVVSVEGNVNSFPVSMTVAEFDSNGNRKETSDVHQLNNDRPTWIVIHGRADNENSNNINDLAQSLNEKGYQVVTLDWRKAANDNAFYKGELHGTTWIEAVGKWAANQLKSLGFSGDKIWLGAHSWGSDVAYEIANAYKVGDLDKNNGNGFGVEGIVALDSAVNPFPLNTYDETKVDFGSVSRVSWAFRSSVFGSENRANTAVANFDVMTPTEYGTCNILNIDPMDPAALIVKSGKFIVDETQAYFGEHGYAVTLFSNIVRGKGDGTLSTLSIDEFMQGQKPLIKLDPSKPDGIILLSFENANGSKGSFTRAVPVSLLNISY